MVDPATLISVQSNVAAALLIDGLHDEAVRRLGEPLDDAVVEVLDAEPDPRAARLGYLARVIEVERFAPARAPAPWLAERLAGTSPEALCARLAFEEPLVKPAPADAPPSWRVPGPGGHVRHFLALRAVGDGPAEHKRSWLTGFFLRCCGELG